jgi:hypothetical protein
MVGLTSAGIPSRPGPPWKTFSSLSWQIALRLGRELAGVGVPLPTSDVTLSLPQEASRSETEALIAKAGNRMDHLRAHGPKACIVIA